MQTPEIEILPEDESAERGLIGALLYADVAMLSEIKMIVKPTDFSIVANKIIFDEIDAIITAGGIVSAVTVRANLIRRKIFDDVGGLEYLQKTLFSQPGRSGAIHYAKIIREWSLRRQTLYFSESLSKRVMQAANYDNAMEIMQTGLLDLGKLVVRGIPDEDFTLGGTIKEVRAQMADSVVRIIPTGFPGLDAAIGGVGAGEMVILGARPSVGKSTAIRQWAIQVAKLGYPVGFISLEEGRHKIGRNCLAAEAGIENGKVRHANMAQHEWNELDEAISRLSGLPIYISDSTRRMADIRAKATVWKSRYGIRLLVVDYLTRIRGVAGTDRYTQASNASTELSDLIKDLQVGGVVAAQLNRALENRNEKRPTIADLRESGQIEQDADGIIFLHREDAFHVGESKDQYQPNGMAEFIVAKWRDSERGQVVKMLADLKYQRFAPIDDYDDAANRARELGL